MWHSLDTSIEELDVTIATQEEELRQLDQTIGTERAGTGAHGRQRSCRPGRRRRANTTGTSSRRREPGTQHSHWQRR